VGKSCHCPIMVWSPKRVFVPSGEILNGPSLVLYQLRDFLPSCVTPRVLMDAASVWASFTIKVEQTGKVTAFKLRVC